MRRGGIRHRWTTRSDPALRRCREAEGRCPTAVRHARPNILSGRISASSASSALRIAGLTMTSAGVGKRSGSTVLAVARSCARTISTPLLASPLPAGLRARVTRARNKAIGRTGISLVEVLVVVAIIGLLVASLVALFGPARRQAHSADSMSRLRQLGLAAAAYQDQTGRFPGSCLECTTIASLDPALCALPRDTTVMGLGQECAQWMVRPPPPRAAHRYSYYGYSDAWIPWDKFQELVGMGENPGWLTDQTESVRLPERVCAFTGTYLRLLFDGAVVRRSHRFGTVPEGRTYNFDQVFADFPDSFYSRKGR